MEQEKQISRSRGMNDWKPIGMKTDRHDQLDMWISALVNLYEQEGRILMMEDENW